MSIPFALRHPYWAARSAWHRFETHVLRACPECKKRRPIKTRTVPIFGTRPSYMWHSQCAFPPNRLRDLKEAIERGDIPTRRAYRGADGNFHLDPPSNERRKA